MVQYGVDACNFSDSPRNFKVRGPCERYFLVLDDGVGKDYGLGLVGSCLGDVWLHY